MSASSFRINLAFDRHPVEALGVGKILASFGELEVMFCALAGEALGMQDTILRTLYRLGATSARIQTADTLTRPLYASFGIGDDYRIAYTMTMKCLAIRNQFAHCNWCDDDAHPEVGLFYADLREAAKSDAEMEYSWKHTDFTVLAGLEGYFALTMEWLRWVQHEMRVKQGRLQSHFWPKPPTQEPPPSHNPPSLHIPPWLDTDQKARHLAYALAAERGDPTPTPEHLVMEAKREAKKAKKQADRQKCRAQRSESAKPQPDDPT
jgi:hypothetical protein